MLERLRAIFLKQSAASVAELEAGRAEVAQALREAREHEAQVMQDYGADMVSVLARGDETKRMSMRRKVEDVQARTRELAGALEGLDARIAAQRVAEALADRGKRERQARKILTEREAIAAEADGHIAALAGINAKCEAMMSQALGVLPEVGRDFLHLTLRSTISDQLGLLSDGALAEAGPARTRQDMNKLRAIAGKPLRNEVLNVSATAKQQSGQLLRGALPEGGFAPAVAAKAA